MQSKIILCPQWWGTNNFIWELSFLNSFVKVNQFVNRFLIRFHLQLFWSNSFQNFFGYFITQLQKIGKFLVEVDDITNCLVLLPWFKESIPLKKSCQFTTPLKKGSKNGFISSQPLIRWHSSSRPFFHNNGRNKSSVTRNGEFSRLWGFWGSHWEFIFAGIPHSNHGEFCSR